MKKKLKRYRPTRMNLGGGKFQETLGTAVVLWGVLRFQEDTTSVVVDAKEDVQVGDVIEVAE